MSKIECEIKYDGKVVATVASVRLLGANLEITFTNGYKVVAPSAMVDEDVLCLVR